MRIPTEEEIEAQLSELKSYSRNAPGHSSDADHLKICEFCQMDVEFDKRTARFGDSICWVDAIARSISNESQIFSALTSNPLTGPESIEILVTIARIAFMIGLKTGIAQRDLDSFDLESLMGGDEK